MSHHVNSEAVNFCMFQRIYLENHQRESESEVFILFPLVIHRVLGESMSNNNLVGMLTSPTHWQQDGCSNGAGDTFNIGSEASEYVPFPPLTSFDELYAASMRPEPKSKSDDSVTIKILGMKLVSDLPIYIFGAQMIRNGAQDPVRPTLISDEGHPRHLLVVRNKVTARPIQFVRGKN